MRPLSFGMLLPCLSTQYLLRSNDVVSIPHLTRIGSTCLSVPLVNNNELKIGLDRLERLICPLHLGVFWIELLISRSDRD